MKMILSIISLLFADLMFAQTNYPPTYYIPSSGQTINNLGYFNVAGQVFYVTTSGSVNLGSNTYTLTYATLPSANTQWSVIFDASNLSVNTATNVNLFGETPLATFPNTKTFYIQFNVVWDGGIPSKKVTYFSSVVQLDSVRNKTVFDSVTTFNDTAIFNGGVRVDTNSLANYYGRTVTLHPNGDLGKGCTPWCITGNTGLSNLNFLGNTDTVALRFRVNNQPSGIIDYNLSNTSFGYNSIKSNTTGTGNVALGATTLYSNTIGLGNVAVGFEALKYNISGDVNTAVGAGSLPSNTTGDNNTSIGYASLTLNNTGNSNTAVGYGALPANTTGSKNTAVGYSSFQTSSTGSYNTAIGADINPAATVSYSVGLGYEAAPSSNQLAISPHVNNIYFSGHTTGVNYILTDTTGLGNFVPKPLSIYTQSYSNPVNGDSATLTTSQNILDAAGTITNYTVILPVSPFSGQIAEFSTTHTITNFKWSTRLSSDADAVESHVPTTLTAGGTIKIMYNTSTRTWYNY